MSKFIGIIISDFCRQLKRTSEDIQDVVPVGIYGTEVSDKDISCIVLFKDSTWAGLHIDLSASEVVGSMVIRKELQ